MAWKILITAMFIAGPAGPVVDAAAAPHRTLDELLLFAPATHPIGNWQPAGLTFQDVWFSAADGTRLHGWFCPADHPRAQVLYLHGNAGNITHRSNVVALLQHRLRATVLIFDYRGYGRSAGQPSVTGILQDARAARSLLAHRSNVEPSELVLLGRSLGGAVAVQLAAESRPRGLVLESTFSSLRDIADYHYRLLAWMVPAAKLDSVTAIARYQGPLLLSHGDADRIIPFALGVRLFQAANEPKTFVRLPRGDHNDPQSMQYYDELDRFLGRLSHS